MSAPLLSTKLNRPPRRANTVSRLRLIARLEHGLRQNEDFLRKLTLVCAPAGYGKTTLVVDWFDQTKLPAGWISLDEGDNDPRRFFSYMLAALQQIDENIGSGVKSIWQSQPPPSDEVLLTPLLNEIADFDKPLILVFDDYHVIHSLAIHHQLAFILEHQPANLHIVIVSREDPLLPIAGLRGRGQVIEITQTDLRFTIGEIADFLDRVMSLTLLREQITALEQRTEGWIAGLQLAALSMQGRDDLTNFIHSFTGSNRFILDYLIEEVFERQTEQVKEFLLKTAVLERLSGALCNSVTGENNGQEMLEMLEQANLFIVALDQSRGWYRYHRLFAELLRHRLRRSDLSESEIHQRASEWFDRNGFESEAIQHALAAQDWERAGQLIQLAATDYLKRGEVLTVLGWFDKIPDDYLISNPQLCFDYCWPLLLSNQFDKAEPLLRDVEQAAQGIPAFLGEVYSAQAFLARATGDHEKMIERSQSALKLLPESVAESRGIVAMNLGVAYWHMGLMQPAEKALNETLEIGIRTDNHYAALTAIIFIGRILAVRGQLHQAAKYSRRAVQQGDQIMINALAYMDLASLHYEWNDLDNCAHNIQKAIDLCLWSRNYEFLVGAQMIQSQLFAAQGDFRAAKETLDKARELVRGGNIPLQTADRLDIAQARLHISKGQPLGPLFENLTDRLDSHPFYRYIGVTKALAMPEMQALPYLDSLSQAASKNGWVFGLIAIRAQQAALTGPNDAGLEYLAEALRLGEQGGFVRSFIDAGEQLIPVLREAHRQGIQTRYVESILAGFPTGSLPDQSGLFEPLSNRELEVLRLVSSGKSNREIAELLVISTGTAKSHVHNICGKLGVSNRTQAAMKAKELELI